MLTIIEENRETSAYIKLEWVTDDQPTWILYYLNETYILYSWPQTPKLVALFQSPKSRFIMFDTLFITYHFFIWFPWLPFSLGLHNEQNNKINI